VSPVRYELGIISQKTTFFIVTAVKTSNPTFLQVLMGYMPPVQSITDPFYSNRTIVTVYSLCEIVG
jgi:hypothetical protein